jgi:hypothetical protein
MTVAALLARARELRSGLASVPEADWGSSAAAGWFWVLGSLVSVYPEGYPLYMRGGAFSAKQLESLLGSYTELRHDTLLYEKPNYAEYGNGDEEEERRPARLPKGFVEPNMEFWKGLVAVLDVVADGYRRQGLFPEELEEWGSLRRFREDSARLAGIAGRELAGEALAEDDYEFVRTFALQYLAVEPGGGSDPEKALSGLAVDIQTVNPGQGDHGRMPEEGGIVTEGLAPPYLMIVLVGNDGEKRACVGTAFNHYEAFLQSRLTDSAWNAVAYRGYRIANGIDFVPEPEFTEMPPKNFWYEPTLR